MLPSSSSAGLLSPQLKVRMSHKQSGRWMQRGQRVRSMGGNHVECQTGGKTQWAGQSNSTCLHSGSCPRLLTEVFSSYSITHKSRAGQTGSDYSLHVGANAKISERYNTAITTVLFTLSSKWWKVTQHCTKNTFWRYLFSPIPIFSFLLFSIIVSQGLLNE